MYFLDVVNSNFKLTESACEKFPPLGYRSFVCPSICNVLDAFSKASSMPSLVSCLPDFSLVDAKRVPIKTFFLLPSGKITTPSMPLSSSKMMEAGNCETGKFRTFADKGGIPVSTQTKHGAMGKICQPLKETFDLYKVWLPDLQTMGWMALWWRISTTVCMYVCNYV